MAQPWRFPDVLEGDAYKFFVNHPGTFRPAPGASLELGACPAQIKTMNMVKKSAIILFSLGILVTGAYGFRKLNYWERSAYVFKIMGTDQRYEGRGGRSGGDFRERSGGKFRERPEREFRQRPEGEFRQRSDDRASFGPGDRGRHGRGDFHGGQKIRLRNVWWFLAVFSAFTVVALYLDRIWLRIRKKRTHSTS